MIIEKIKELKMSGSIAVLISLFMPLFPKLLPILLIFLFLSLAFEFKNLKYHKEFKVMTWLFALTYLFYFFGLLVSDHISDGLFILQLKLSFLVLPLFFLFHGPFHISTVRKILYAFVLGCFVNSILCLNKGIQCYLETGWWECFFSSYFSYAFHTTYLSIYYCFSILIIIYFLINYISRMRIWMIIALFFLLFYFVGFVLLLSSKGGLIALITVILVSAIYFIYKKGSRRSAIFALLGLFSLGSIGFFTSEVIRSRIQNAIVVYQLSTEELFEKHRESTESTEVRLMIWHVTNEQIKRHPFGVGTGDAKYILLENYKAYGMTGAYQGNLNCHNQFLETTLAIGIHGLIVLIVFLIYVLTKAIRSRNFLLLWIAVIIILNLLFESMFETQAGVIFFVFFTGLLLTSVPEVIPVSPEENEKN